MAFNRKGVELALNTIIISILGIIVLVVLVLIFTGTIRPLPELAQCGQGVYADFECVEESLKDSPLCVKSPCNQTGDNLYCCPKSED